MIRYFFFLLWFVPLCTSAATVNTLSLSSVFSEQSSYSVISLQPTLINVLPKTEFDLSLDAGKFRSQVNYNPDVEDFVIEKTMLSASADVSWDQFLTLGFLGLTESINDNEVRVQGVTSKLRIRAFDFALKATLNDRYIRQVEDYMVLNTNIKDRLTLRSTKKTLSLSYYGFETFIFSINHSTYAYDTEVNQAIVLLSSQAALQRHSAAFLSQIYSLIDHETNIDMIYSLTDTLDLELMLGQTVDYIEPYAKSNEYRLGSTYYFRIFSLGGGITAIQDDESSESLYSGDVTLSYEF